MKNSLIVFFSLLVAACCCNPLPEIANCARVAAPCQTTPSPNIIAPNYCPSHYSCVKTFHEDICGYDCKISPCGLVKCATFPGQRCMIGLSGYIDCGYDCHRSRTGFVKCGLRYGDKCLETASGDIICGLNCRILGGFIKCDYSPDFRNKYVQTEYARWR